MKFLLLVSINYNVALLITKLPVVKNRRCEMRRASLLISIIESHHLYLVRLIFPKV